MELCTKNLRMTSFYYFSVLYFTTNTLISTQIYLSKSLRCIVYGSKSNKFHGFLKRAFFIVFIFYSINSFSQCDANFTYNNSYGSLPVELNFESKSNFQLGSYPIYSWTIDDQNISDKKSFQYKAIENKIYKVCNSVSLSSISCYTQECKYVLVNVQVEDCGILPNKEFDKIINPSSPGKIGSSDNFNLDVLGWRSSSITPYYCRYSDNSYVALRMGAGQVEAIQTDKSLNLEVGKYYTLTFKYSVQRLKFGNVLLVFNIGPSSIDVALVNNFGEKVNIGKVYNPIYNFPANTSKPEYLLQTDFDCIENKVLEWKEAVFGPFLYNSELMGFNKLQITGSAPTGYLGSNVNVPVVFFDSFCMDEHIPCEKAPTLNFYCKSGYQDSINYFKIYGYKLPSEFSNCGNDFAAMLNNIGDVEVEKNISGYGFDISISKPFFNTVIENDVLRFAVCNKFGRKEFCIPVKFHCGLNNIVSSNTDVESMQKKSQYEIYPNPVSSELIVYNKDFKRERIQNTVIQLFDLTGRLVLKQELNEEKEFLYLDDLSSGLYILNILKAKSIVLSKKISVIK